MQIDQTTSGVTIIRDRPWFVPGFGLLFLLVGSSVLVRRTMGGSWTQNDVVGVIISITLGGGLFLYTCRRSEFRFDTLARQLSWKIRTLWGESNGVIPFDAIERVALHQGPEWDSTTYRVVLYTPGLFPLSNGFTWQQQRLEDVVTAIEAALNGEPSSGVT